MSATAFHQYQRLVRELLVARDLAEGVLPRARPPVDPVGVRPTGRENRKVEKPAP
jgi:hypothetical protein